MRDDSLLPADQTAALDEAFVLVDRERDVDSLAVADAAHVDEAVLDRHGSATDVDSVELGANDPDAIQHDAVHLVDLDAVLTADDGDVLDGDIGVAHLDPADNDRAAVADQPLAPVDHERTAVDSRSEVDSRGQMRVPDAACDDEGQRDGRSERDARAAELAAVLRVGETKPWEDRLAEDLCEEPRRSEQGERNRKRCADVEGDDD